MKKSLLISPLLLFAIACGGHKLPAEQAKAEELVKDHLSTTLPKTAAYQPLAFDTLREVPRSYALDDPEGQKLNGVAKAYSDSALSYRKKADELILNNKTADMSIFKKYQTAEEMFLKKSDSVSKVIIENSKDYEGKSDQYSILHTYNAKDNLGHVVKHVTNFWIDGSVTKIQQQQEAQ